MKRMIFIVLLLITTTLPAWALPSNTSGPWGIDAAGFRNLSTALASPATTGKTVVVSKPMAINNKTLSSDRHIRFTRGGQINPAAGKTFDFNGQTPSASKYQIFGGAGLIMGLTDSWAEWFANDPTKAVAALNVGGVYHIGVNTYIPSGQMIPKEGVTFEGTNPLFSIIDASGLTGFAIAYVTGNGQTERQAPSFKRFQLKSNNGIQLNDPTHGFTNDAATQEFMMRPVIEDCIFTAGNTLGIGVQISKGFDGLIRHNKFSGFSIPIDMHGSDISAIQDNRFLGWGTYGISLNGSGSITYNTFGSQSEIAHNEFLAPANGSLAYIYSNDLHPRIYDNYLESQGYTTTAGIWLSSGYDAVMRDNRLEIPVADVPNWLRVDSQFASIVAQNNTTQGPSVGPPLFPAAGYKYLYSNSHRAIVNYSGNDSENGTYPNAFPFNSQPNYAASDKAAFVWTPDLPGLDYSYNYNNNMLINGGSAVIPPLSGTGSIIQITTGVAGTVNISVIAKGSVTGQILNWQLSNGSTGISSGSVTLTTNFANYVLSTATPTTGLTVQFWNNDTTHNGNALIKSVSVTY
ncbi:MAG: hypothetical protein M0T70_04380 [Geobacteraceae bacterium]|nr:hypothetical protein [Geobacteraceae bacterium]